MAKCTVCGAKASFMMSMCDSCLAKAEQASRERDRLSKVAPDIGVSAGAYERAVATTPAAAPPPAHPIVPARDPACAIIGTLLVIAGFYFLVLSPGQSTSSYSPDVVNLQRLFLGQTLAISGSIFLAAALRPKT